jgi:hypothetical protein
VGGLEQEQGRQIAQVGGAGCKKLQRLGSRPAVVKAGRPETWRVQSTSTKPTPNQYHVAALRGPRRPAETGDGEPTVKAR